MVPYLFYCFNDGFAIACIDIAFLALKFFIFDSVFALILFWLLCLIGDTESSKLMVSPEAESMEWLWMVTLREWLF